MVVDDLCREQQEVLYTAKKDKRFKNVWSWNGQVYGKTGNDEIVNILYGQAIDDALQG